jgi:LPXTG-motif cell wall-anchored protein
VTPATVSDPQSDPPVAVVAAGTETLPRTGSPTIPIVCVGASLLALGLLVTAKPRRRYFIR